jgi:hypothetical protein
MVALFCNVLIQKQLHTQRSCGITVGAPHLNPACIATIQPGRGADAQGFRILIADVAPFFPQNVGETVCIAWSAFRNSRPRQSSLTWFFMKW